MVRNATVPTPQAHRIPTSIKHTQLQLPSGALDRVRRLFLFRRPLPAVPVPRADDFPAPHLTASATVYPNAWRAERMRIALPYRPSLRHKHACPQPCGSAPLHRRPRQNRKSTPVPAQAIPHSRILHRLHTHRTVVQPSGIPPDGSRFLSPSQSG